MMLLCLSAASILPSRSNLSRADSFRLPVLKILRATSRGNASSCALYTVPMPPVPRTSSILKRPSIVLPINSVPNNIASQKNTAVFMLHEIDSKFSLISPFSVPLCRLGCTARGEFRIRLERADGWTESSNIADGWSESSHVPDGLVRAPITIQS